MASTAGQGPVTNHSEVFPSTEDLVNTSSYVLDVQEYLESQNRQYVADLAPTLSYLAIMMLSGLVGNTLVFLVYYKRFKPSVTRTYILAMSVCDLMVNILSLPADIVEVRFHSTFDQRWLCKGFRTVKSFLGFLSAFILVAVALDRQRAICHPQSIPTTVRRTVVVLVVVSVLALAFTVPYSIVTGPLTVEHKDTNITGLECSIDDVYFKSLFLFIYNAITGLVLVLCITLMLVSYGRIARKLWQHKKNTAIIMDARKDSRKASNVTSHTYTFEDSSSDKTQRSSVKSQQQSTKTKDHQPRMELAQKADPLQEDARKDSTAETSLEDPSGIRSLTSERRAANLPPQTVSSEDKDNDGIITSAVNSDFGHEDVSTNESKTTSSDVQVLSDVRKASGCTEREQGSSRSRSVLSHIRRTATDAKSFITRKKPHPRSRGAVKKIPTRTTFMMFVLTVIFIANYLPYLLVVSLRSRLGHEMLIEGMRLNGYHIALRSYFINGAVNPLVYSFCSARFRQECRRLLSCKRN